MDPLNFIPIAVVFFIVLLITGYTAGKKRRETFHRFARRRGLSFSGRADVNAEEGLESFTLFSDDTGKNLSNLIKGEMDGVYIKIFDYRSRTGTGQTRAMKRESVIILQSKILRLPSFEMYPVNIIHKVLPLKRNQDIDFQTAEGFSKAYLLRSYEENAIREIFDDQVLSYFENHTGLTIEGNGDRLLYYRDGTLMKPDEIQPFLMEGIEMVKLFESRMKSS